MNLFDPRARTHTHAPTVGTGGPDRASLSSVSLSQLLQRSLRDPDEGPGPLQLPRLEPVDRSHATASHASASTSTKWTDPSLTFSPTTAVRVESINTPHAAPTTPNTTATPASGTAAGPSTHGTLLLLQPPTPPPKRKRGREKKKIEPDAEVDPQTVPLVVGEGVEHSLLLRSHHPSAPTRSRHSQVPRSVVLRSLLPSGRTAGPGSRVPDRSIRHLPPPSRFPWTAFLSLRPRRAHVSGILALARVESEALVGVGRAGAGQQSKNKDRRERAGGNAGTPTCKRPSLHDPSVAASGLPALPALPALLLFPHLFRPPRNPTKTHRP
jgi:hypothetical protein